MKNYKNSTGKTPIITIIKNGVKDGNENTKRLCEFVTEKNCDEDGFARFIHEVLL